jgi:hypothetical protein
MRRQLLLQKLGLKKYRNSSHQPKFNDNIWTGFDLVNTMESDELLPIFILEDLDREEKHMD